MTTQTLNVVTTSRYLRLEKLGVDLVQLTVKNGEEVWALPGHSKRDPHTITTSEAKKQFGRAYIIESFKRKAIRRG